MRVDLAVLHDCEGGYEGSIRWFEVSGSNVSAHYVIREDGREATQVVDLADNAWHARTFNRRSVGVEMDGFANRDFDAPLLATKRAEPSHDQRSSTSAQDTRVSLTLDGDYGPETWQVVTSFQMHAGIDSQPEAKLLTELSHSGRPSLFYCARSYCWGVGSPPTCSWETIKLIGETLSE